MCTDNLDFIVAWKFKPKSKLQIPHINKGPYIFYMPDWSNVESCVSCRFWRIWEGNWREICVDGKCERCTACVNTALRASGDEGSSSVFLSFRHQRENWSSKDKPGLLFTDKKQTLLDGEPGIKNPEWSERQKTEDLPDFWWWNCQSHQLMASEFCGGVQGWKGEGGWQERSCKRVCLPISPATGCLTKVATLHSEPPWLHMSAENWCGKGA